MKTKLFIFAALFGSFFMMQSCDDDEAINFPEYPQEILQFDTARFIEIVVSTSPADTSININVPENKVLKIESAHLSQREPSTLFLNNTMLATVGNTYAYNGAPASFPVWLPEGSYTLRLQIDGASGGVGNISGIQYNIVR